MRSTDVERRIGNLENAVVQQLGPGALPGHSRAPTSADAGYCTAPLPPPQGGYGIAAPHGHQPQLPPPTVGGPSRPAGPGSSQNAKFLPYAIEAVAKKYQQKLPHDNREW